MKELLKDDILICVVENGTFDAAAVVYSDFEMREFSDPIDARPRTWMLMDRAKVLELCPPVEKYLEY